MRAGKRESGREGERDESRSGRAGERGRRRAGEQESGGAAERGRGKAGGRECDNCNLICPARSNALLNDVAAHDCMLGHVRIRVCVCVHVRGSVCPMCVCYQHVQELANAPLFDYLLAVLIPVDVCQSEKLFVRINRTPQCSLKP